MAKKIYLADTEGFGFFICEEVSGGESAPR